VALAAGTTGESNGGSSSGGIQAQTLVEDGPKLEAGYEQVASAAEEEEDGDKNVAAVAELAAAMCAPQAAKVMLPLATKLVDQEFFGLSKIPLVKKTLTAGIKLALDGEQDS
jgi:hypothetical protein